MPQNSSISGQPYWKGIQLDEVAMPILLAWRLRREDALSDFDPWMMVSRAASYLVLNGPVTAQERWEENAGYSPSTLAAIIAGLACAAEIGQDHQEPVAADFLLAYADWLSAHLEGWTVTSRGELLAGAPRHYVRITPAVPAQADGSADPDSAVIAIANHGGEHAARNIVSGDFLQLVRLGVRAADDPLIISSLAVIDRVLRHDLPQGPCWRRYNHDGYGQKDDGGAFDGSGVGRCWPILTGERGHYELAAQRDPRPFIATLERFANVGGMLPEQVWDVSETPTAQLRCGGPTGSAMPLCWAHAEYLALVRSAMDGKCFDRVEPAFQRFVEHPVASTHEMWTASHAIRRIPAGCILRLILAEDAQVVWSSDGWATTSTTGSAAIGALRLWYADLPTASAAVGMDIAFTFRWKKDQRWEGMNHTVTVCAALAGPQAHRGGATA